MIKYSDRNMFFNFSELYYLVQDTVPEDIFTSMSLSDTEMYVKNALFAVIRGRDCEVEVFAMMDSAGNYWGGYDSQQSDIMDTDEYIRVTIVSGESAMYLQFVYGLDEYMLYAEVCDWILAKEGLIV